jgi:uncharacterized protein YodC (DUF2158 family)
MSEVVPLIKPKSPEVSEKFVIGSTVRLKGGGAIMTVRKPGKQSIVVDWLDTDSVLNSAEFPPPMLKHADPNEDDTKKEESA